MLLAPWLGSKAAAGMAKIGAERRLFREVSSGEAVRARTSLQGAGRQLPRGEEGLVHRAERRTRRDHHQQRTVTDRQTHA